MGRKAAEAKTVDELAAEAAERLGLSSDQAKELRRVAYRVYDTYSFDLQGTDGTMTRDEIIEFVLDSSHIEDSWVRRPVPPEIKRALAKGSYEDLAAVVRPAFPYATYDVGPYPDEVKQL